MSLSIRRVYKQLEKITFKQVDFSSSLSCWERTLHNFQKDPPEFLFSFIKTSHNEIENTVGERFRI